MIDHEAKAREWGKRHPEFIREDALKKVKRKYHKKKRSLAEGETVKKGTHRALNGGTARSDAIIRNALTLKWLAFLEQPDNANKVLNQIRADFAKEVLKCTQ
ncbi:MAG: hypothetical protein PHI12_08685 [Dehalococcoidales bacterium]|nr:hypothetical protein [Dehalococcoidales bacterium]